jgi:hypothetical protein
VAAGEPDVESVREELSRVVAPVVAVGEVEAAVAGEVHPE